ncbi:hypothetical protein [Niastella vici]|nr:hypothetical protein [Niastella vici]
MKIEVHRGLWSEIGSSPPEVMWPPPRVIQQQIPKPAWVIRNKVLALIVLLLTLPFLVSSYLYKVLSPFALNSQRFLVFFPLLAISCIICFVILQQEKSRTLNPLVAAHYPSNATIFQITRFLHGKERAIQAAIIDLLRRELLVLTTDRFFLVNKHRYIKPVKELNPLVEFLLKEERSCVSYERIVYVWDYEATANDTAMRALKLLANHKEPFLKRYHLLLLPYLAGIARLFLEISNGNKLDNLIIEMMALVLACIGVMKIVSRKSLVKRKVKQMIKTPKGIRLLHGDYVVYEFALKRKEVIERYADGIVLADIFGLGPVADRISNAIWLFLEAAKEDEDIPFSWDGSTIKWK